MEKFRPILLSGATSFTGSHIAKELRDSGFEVIATLTKKKESYLSESADPLLKLRMSYANPKEWIDEAPFGSDRFLDLCKTHEFSTFINHGSDIRGYRDPHFDYLQSVSRSLHRASTIIPLLKAQGCRRILHSGSIFEPDEGSPEAGHPLSSPAISIYGVSKTLTWQALRFFSENAGLGITKIVIPNPIGPFENSDRLFPTLYRKWCAGETASLFGADLIRDHLPAPWLARLYVKEITKALDVADSETRVLRPSGFVLKNEKIVQQFSEELKSSGFDKSCAVKIEKRVTTEPLIRANTEPVLEMKDESAQKSFWRDLCQSLSATH